MRRLRIQALLIVIGTFLFVLFQNFTPVKKSDFEIDPINHIHSMPQPVLPQQLPFTYQARSGVRSAQTSQSATIPRPTIGEGYPTGFEKSGITKEVGMLVLVMWPVNENDEQIDPKINLANTIGYVNSPGMNYRLGDLHRKYSEWINWQMTEMIKIGSRASRFRPEKNSQAVSAVQHVLKGWYDIYDPIPLNPNGFKRDNPGQYVNPFLDVDKLLDRVDICDYVDNKNVKQVWILFLGDRVDAGKKNENDFVWPEWHINSSYINYEKGVPDWTSYLGRHCKHAYTIYPHEFNKPHLASHIWGHSIENMLTTVDHPHRELWQGASVYRTKNASDIMVSMDSKGMPQLSVIPGSIAGGLSNISRCGSVHNSPNAINDNDKGLPMSLAAIWEQINNPDSVKEAIAQYAASDVIIRETDQASVMWPSDCLDWNPDGPGGYGQVSALDSTTWFPTEVPWVLQEYVWHTWNFQHMPGYDNKITHNGRPFRNWWEVYTDLDGMLANGETLLSPQKSYKYLVSGGSFKTSKGDSFISQGLADPDLAVLLDGDRNSLVGIEGQLSARFNLGGIKSVKQVNLPRLQLFRPGDVSKAAFKANFKVSCSTNLFSEPRVLIEKIESNPEKIKSMNLSFIPAECRYLSVSISVPQGRTKGRIFLSEVDIQ